MEVSGAVPARRRLTRIGGWTAGVVGLSGTATAHGPQSHGGEPVAFAVVVGLPIVAGLGGGVLAIRGLRMVRMAPSGRRLGVVLGVTFAVLGATFAVSAVTTSRQIGLVGGTVGAVGALWVSRSDEPQNRGCHADLTLGAVSVHRLLEGLALGALYSAGAAVGLISAVLLAGHTAFETAAVGGLHTASARRSRAVGAVLLVQASYAVGAFVGLGVADALPASARVAAIAIAGGALLIVGASETDRSIGARRPATA